MIYKSDLPLQLESGKVLPGLQLAYRTYGKRRADDSNVVWICHALTANADVADWWSGLVGQGKLFDPEHHFIVCANVLGSCYGSTGPLSINPETGEPYYHDFPELSIRDIIQSFIRLRNYLGIQSISHLIGGSMGGMQALEWAIMEPKVVKNLTILASCARHSPWGVAFNESQRMAIRADHTWANRADDAGIEGMKVARATALLSYRNYQAYAETQAPTAEDPYPAVRYQQYQGEKLAKRFNAFSYYFLSKTMDSHDVGRGRNGLTHALSQIEASTLVIAINSDILFLPAESMTLVNHIPDAVFSQIPSAYGHDGFLLEYNSIRRAIERHFLEFSPYRELKKTACF